MPNNLGQHINKETKQIKLNPDSTFNFTCASSCWGTCCIKENVGILQLSIYDTYKLLAKREDLKLVDLIDVKVDEKTNLPRAFIKWTEKGWCPNLEEDGSCKVYMDRPFACRIFPLSAEFRINDSTNEINANYLLRENFCYGFHSDANPKAQALKDFISSDDFQNHEKYEKLEIKKRDEWAKTYDLAKLNNQHILTLSHTMYCLKDKITSGLKSKSTYFLDYYAEKLKVPKRTKRIESFTPAELTEYALEELAPRLLKEVS